MVTGLDAGRIIDTDQPETFFIFQKSYEKKKVEEKPTRDCVGDAPEVECSDSLNTPSARCPRW